MVGSNHECAEALNEESVVQPIFERKIAGIVMLVGIIR